VHINIRDQISNTPVGGRFACLRDARLVQALGAFVSTEAAHRIVKAVGIIGCRSMTAAEVQNCCQLSDEETSRVIAARELAESMMPQEPIASCVASALVHLPPGLALLETEVLIGIALTSRLNVRGTLLLSKGGTASAALTPRDVFVPLVRLGASSFILAHNHPSGDPTPSNDDISMTERIAHAGDLLGIQLLDHIIVARSGAVSLSEVGCTSIPYVPTSLGCALEPERQVSP